MTQDTIQQTISDYEDEYKRMWDNGEFEWNAHDGDERGKKPVSMWRIWKTFIVPMAYSIATTAREEEQARIKAAIKRLWQHVPQGGIPEMISHGTLVSRKEVLGIITNNKT